MSVGYSKTPLDKKLGIKTDPIIVIGAPQNFTTYLNTQSIGVQKNLKKDSPFIHFFSTSRNELTNEFPRLKESLTKDGSLWISWPKTTSKVPTDLNENIIREIGLNHGLVDVKVIAIDDDWSGLKFVYRLVDR